VNTAAGISLASASVNLATSIFHLSLSPAPGWRSARTFAAITFTAGLYSLGSIVFALDGLGAAAYVLAGRLIYLVGSLHCVAWLVFAFGGRRGSPRNMPVAVQLLALASVALAVAFAATGFGLRETVTVVEVPWAGVRYHYPLTTIAGDVYGFLFPAFLAAAFARLLARWHRGEPRLRWHMVGFPVFFACAVVEVLAANRVIVFPSIVDIGILVVVLPLTVHVVERLIDDARRLRVLSGALSGEAYRATRERDRARTALLEAEHFASLGRVAAGVSHQINNPLMYLQMALGELESFLGPDGASHAVKEALEGAREAAARIGKVVETLRGHLRGAGEGAAIELSAVAEAARKVAGPQCGRGVIVETDFHAAPLVLADEPRLVQAALNVLVNAVQAIREGGGSRVIVRTATARTGEAELSVIDDGPGMPHEILGRVGEPYVTTRAGRGGLGLGLFLARGIVEAHGGTLEVDSRKGVGTRISMRLPPLATGRAPSVRVPSAAESVPPSESRQLRVLLVDDEPLVLRYLARGLQPAWNVATAATGAEALRLAEEQPFDAVVCDLMMAGMSGMEFAERLGRSNPGLRARVLFLTAGALSGTGEEFLARPDVVHLIKPVRIGDLDRTLRALATRPT